MPPALVALLDELDALLARQAQHVRDGEADALAAVEDVLQQRLGLLARASAGRAIPEPMRERIAAMARRVHGTQTMLVRRQQAVQRSLDVLGAGHAGLQDARNTVVYGARGGLSGGSLRRTAFERV